MRRINTVMFICALIVTVISCSSTDTSGNTSASTHTNTPTSGNMSAQAGSSEKNVNKNIPNISVTSAEYFTYSINEEEDNRYITINSYTGTDPNIKIPAKINDIPVIEVGSDSFRNKIVHTIIIPEGVTTINNHIAELSPNDSYVATIVLPESVRSVGMMGFSTSNDSLIQTMMSGTVPFTVIIIIGTDVKLASDTYKGAPTFPFLFESFYIKNGRKAGVYTIQRNTGSWRYSPN